MRHLPRVSLLLLMLIPVTGDAAEKFILGAEDQAGPWGQSNGTGCGNDIVKAAFAASGDTVVLDVLPYEQAKRMVLEGKIAGCFSMSWDPAFEGKIVLSGKPLYLVECTFMAKKGESGALTSPDKLPPGRILGLVAGYEYPPVVRGAHGVRIEENASEERNLKLLASGRIDATAVFCDPLKSLDFLLDRAGVTGKVDSCFIAGIMGSFVGFSLSHPAGRRARTGFDRGMAIIQDNGTYNAIVKNWKSRTRPSSGQDNALVYMCEDIPPSNYLDNGVLKGVSVEILRLMWSTMGIAEQRISVVPWARGYHSLQTEENRVLFSITRTRERESLFKWVGPIFTVKNVLMGRADRRMVIQTLDEARKYRIGTIKDDVMEKYLLENKFDRDAIEGVSTLEKNFEKLNLGRIDLVAHSEATIRYFIQFNRLDSSQFRVCYVLSESPNYFAFSSDISDDLVQRFQTALESRQSQHRQILRKYGLIP